VGSVALLTNEVTDAVPGLYRYALSLSRDHDLAEDLVQDTVVRALEKGDTFRGDSSVPTWMHRILHHRYVDLVRSSDAAGRRWTSPDRTEQRWRDDSYTVDGEQVVLRAERDDELRDTLSHLPVSYRSAVVLHDVEGWTGAQIAEVQEVSLAAAKQRIRRGRMMLVDELAAHADRHAELKGVPMRCWAVREKVTDYLDDELSPLERTTLERHLGWCPTCPPLFAGLVGARDGLGRLRDPDSVITPELATRLRAARTGL
jgi:RNA polymerase sigma-70 factor (ECF subfamily)